MKINLPKAGKRCSIIRSHKQAKFLRCELHSNRNSSPQVNCYSGTRDPSDIKQKNPRGHGYQTSELYTKNECHVIFCLNSRKKNIDFGINYSGFSIRGFTFFPVFPVRGIFKNPRDGASQTQTIIRTWKTTFLFY